MIRTYEIDVVVSTQFDEAIIILQSVELALHGAAKVNRRLSVTTLVLVKHGSVTQLIPDVNEHN